MNKLILVGNGFDLAHGLPTSYKDFLNDFWSNLEFNQNKEFVKSLIELNELYTGYFNYNQIKSFNDLLLNLELYCNEYGYIFRKGKEDVSANYNSTTIFNFKNVFFRTINLKDSIENWVDIENEYYLELKKVAKLPNLDEREKRNCVKKLNTEFEQIKNIFEEYLTKEVVEKFDFNNLEDRKEWPKISELLKPIIITKEPYLRDKILNLSKEFSFQDDENTIKGYEKKIKSISEPNFEPIIFDSLVLSFNYTPSIFYYKYYINNDFGRDIISCNYIHGELKSIHNKINFGFGDEIDNFYKEIENIGDNEYLKNFKSFQYSNTQNYDDLLRYIDSDKYQVYILGHSCGLSDRVLLNTIFEHKNCRSIKVYYYQKEDDNYTDIIQNISRHFNNKSSMRRKIVNKTLCSPLPQTVRFQKK